MRKTTKNSMPSFEFFTIKKYSSIKAEEILKSDYISMQPLFFSPNTVTRQDGRQDLQKDGNRMMGIPPSFSDKTQIL